MRKCRKWLSRGIMILLILFFVFTLYFPVASRLTGEEYPSVFGFRQALVLTGSMEPTVHVGDLILIRNGMDYQQGDIVTYLDGQRLVTHRIVQVEPDIIITQGDANNAPDHPIRIEQILGRMVFRLPHVGTLAGFLKTQAGIAILLLAVWIVCSRDGLSISRQAEIR